MKEINRKEFLVKSGSILAATYVITSTVSCDSKESLMDKKIRLVNLEDTISELKKMETAKNIVSNTEFSWFQILNHCAQSIEYSLTGYPENKSAIFRMTAGKIASNIFSSRGYMSHDLNAPIPNSPSIPRDGDEKEAMLRLYKAIDDFKNFCGDMKMHFAYGELTKLDYEKAHAMHIANHLSYVNAEF